MFCLSKLGSCVEDSSRSLPTDLWYLERALLLWYIWKGSNLWDEQCLLACFLIIDIFAGTISPSLQFSFEIYGSFRSSMQVWISFNFIPRFFFSFLNSLTSQVKLTVSLFNLTIIVRRMLSSIFLSLFVLTTCLMRYYLFSIASSVLISLS